MALSYARQLTRYSPVLCPRLSQTPPARASRPRHFSISRTSVTS
uniref:Uncharacterized protein n=1 Tax=Arundo donax TaxID=35708 RepID=A0A0A9GZB0_ARUDO